MKKLKLGDKLSLFVLLLFSLWAIWPLFQSGLPNTHDGQHHTVRLAAFHQALVDGQFPPRWAGNLNSGYGSPVLSFSFPLPFFLAEFFHLVGLSFIDSFKLVFILGFLLSGMTMFFFLRKLTDSLASFVGSFLYLFIPYRFLDTYVRGEVGEAIFFVFPPLFLFLIWDLKKRDWLRTSLAALSVAAMLLSHPLLAGILITLFSFYFVLKNNLRLFLLVTFLGSALAAFNIAPIILEKSLTNAELFIQTNYQNQFPTLKSLLYSSWNWGPALPDNPAISMAFQLGIAQWTLLACLGVFLMWALFRREVNTNTKLLALSFSLIALFLFLMTPYSRYFWDKLGLLQSILYPWRLLGIQVFLTAFSAALLIKSIDNKKVKILLSVLFVILAFYGNRNHTQIVGRTNHHDSFYLSYQGTADMWGEFLPKSAKPIKETPPQKVGVVDGEAEISQIETSSKDVSFKLKAKSESFILVNTLDFPGWKVFVDGKETARETSDMIAFKVPEGEHLVRVEFAETFIRNISNLLSLASLVLVFGVIAVKLKKKLR